MFSSLGHSTCKPNTCLPHLSSPYSETVSSAMPQQLGPPANSQHHNLSPRLHQYAAYCVWDSITHGPGKAMRQSRPPTSHTNITTHRKVLRDTVYKEDINVDSLLFQNNNNQNPHKVTMAYCGWRHFIKHFHNPYLLGVSQNSVMPTEQTSYICRR